MTHSRLSTAVGALVLLLPVAAFADISGTNQVLTTGQRFNFDTGNVVSSGGDILFSSAGITAQGTAGTFSVGAGGSTVYSQLTQATLGISASLYSQTPIPASSLAVTEVFAVHTNGGNYAKAMITATASGSITFQYTTFGVTGSGGGGGTGPSITAVQDAGSYTSNVAQGSIFVVKGSNLSGAGFVQTQFPLPTTSSAATGSVTISFSPLTGGSPVQAYIIYLYNQSGVNQLAAVLPSTTPTGSYNVSVTYNGQNSAGFLTQVVAKKPGLITQDSTGGGLAVVQNFISTTEYDIDRFTTGTVSGIPISPAHPGQTLIAWLVGMGPVPGSDNTGSQGYDFTQHGVSVQVLVGGTAITPFYAGRAPGLSGADQIDFTLPSNIPTGCVVSFQVSVGGTLSQTGFISIAPTGANACVQPGYTTSQLQNFDNGGSITTGGFSLGQLTLTAPGVGSFTTGNASGGFNTYTGFELAAIPASASTAGLSGCLVTQIPGPTSATIGGSGIGLDAGHIALNGPSGSGFSNLSLAESNNAYSLTFSGIGSSLNAKLLPGAYTLSGGGGKDVGTFSASVNIATPLAVTGNLPSVIDRSSALTVNWTGGASSDLVIVSGEATNTVNGVATGAGFTCITTAGAGGLTVPSSILSQLPAVTAASISNTNSLGLLSVAWFVTPSGSNGLFTAPLTAGGNISNASFSVTTSTASTPAYQ